MAGNTVVGKGGMSTVFGGQTLHVTTDAVATGSGVIAGESDGMAGEAAFAVVGGGFDRLAVGVVTSAAPEFAIARASATA